jgi:hypothetical protein
MHVLHHKEPDKQIKLDTARKTNTGFFGEWGSDNAEIFLPWAKGDYTYYSIDCSNLLLGLVWCSSRRGERKLARAEQRDPRGGTCMRGLPLPPAVHRQGRCGAPRCSAWWSRVDTRHWLRRREGTVRAERAWNRVALNFDGRGLHTRRLPGSL